MKARRIIWTIAVCSCVAAIGGIVATGALYLFASFMFWLTQHVGLFGAVAGMFAFIIAIGLTAAALIEDSEAKN